MWNRFLSIVVIALFTVSMIGIGSAITDDDAEFYQWTDYKWKRMARCMEQLVVAQLNDDADKFHAKGWLLMTTCEEALGEIESYNVSNDMLPIKDAFQLVLRDTKDIGYWACEAGKGEYISKGLLFKYRDSAEKAETSTMAYVEAVNKYETIHGPLPTPQPTPTPEPEPPGFEAVFAIAGLLAVAYLVHRRKS